MEQALEQYGKKSTTIGQMRQNITEFKSPIYVACVDPPFKASFFRNNGVNETSGAVKYFWMQNYWKKLLENTTYSALDIYMNMTYQLGSDWNINMIIPNGLVYISIFLTVSFFGSGAIRTPTNGHTLAAFAIGTLCLATTATLYFRGLDKTDYLSRIAILNLCQPRCKKFFWYVLVSVTTCLHMINIISKIWSKTAYFECVSFLQSLHP